MNWIFRTLFVLVMLHPASDALAQASITLTGPSSNSYMAPANFDLRADYYVSSGPKAEFIEDPVITQNGSPIARLLEGAVPVRGLPAGRYEYMFTGRAVRILPDGDMTSRPLRSGPIVIEVTSPPEPVDAATPGATSYPNPSLAGRRGSVSIQMINTGETTWRAGTYLLDTPHDFTRDFWQFTAQPVTHDVAPGASFTFNFSITPRYYDQHVEWRNIEFQLRRDQSWFGLKSYTSVFVREPMNASTFESQSVPLQMEAGKQYAINVRMRNTGDDPWSSEAGYSLGPQNPADNTIWGTHRIQTGSVAPGSVGDFSATVTAPAAAGTYNFQWRMVRDGVEWFGVQTPSITVDVIAPPPPPPPTIVGTTFVYDALGRSIGTSSDSELGPLLTATTYLPGNRTARFNARGNVTTTTYQAYETPGEELAVRVAEPEGRTTHIARDRFGSILSIARDVGAGSIERHYVYDTHHRLCKSVEPESGTTAMGYDQAGRVLWMATGLDLPSLQSCDAGIGQSSPRSVTRSYDVNGRLAGISSPDGYGNQTFSYSPDGLLIDASASNGGSTGTAVTRMSYNSRRMISSETSSLPGKDDWTVSYGYDRSGALASQMLASGVELRYLPDALGRPRHIVDQHGRIFASAVEHGANGRISGFIYGNGIVHRMVQNVRQIPARISAGFALDLEYAYDENANVASILDHIQGPAADRRMTYDDADRLSTVQLQLPGMDQRFAYDQADNLVRIETAGRPTRHHYFDVRHRLANVRDDAGATIVGLAYDPAGNLAKKNGIDYSFDLQNRLRYLGAASSYGYDAHGRRVTLQAASGYPDDRYMYLSSGEISRGLDGKSGGLTDNIYLEGSSIASIRTAENGAETIEFHHGDALGTRASSTLSGGGLLRRSNYSAYGQGDQPASGAIGYTGHVEDADSGLIYMQQRYYDAEIGAFLSVDSVTPHALSGRGFNRYWYADGNPYRFTDPDGRLACGNGASCGDRIRELEQRGAFPLQAGGGGGGQRGDAPSTDQHSSSALAQQSSTGKKTSDGEIPVPGVVGWKTGVYDLSMTPDRVDSAGVAITGAAVAGGGAVVVHFGASYVAAASSGLIASTKGAWRNLSFDGPSPGGMHANGRLAGVRWKGGQWGVRLDLHPVNSGSTPILHINYGPAARGEAAHLILFDPRWIKGDGK